MKNFIDKHKNSGSGLILPSPMKFPSDIVLVYLTCINADKIFSIFYYVDSIGNKKFNF
jgi:hypothetical protein